ncbi:MAG: monofunctional biosynthetic peptidoglycan transglycosylase [Bacteroidales bacterium]|nr:monofunctional biosynthetic peptidoglycan transglycosylase [Bacteroidales bacterium]
MPFWFVVTSILLVAALKWVPVRYTPLMLKRSIQFGWLDGCHAVRTWVPLEDISPEVVSAAIAAEDARFLEHSGFDWEEVGQMLGAHRSSGKPLRGCSTISQQTAKNVFTFSTRTIARKAVETYWTVLIEAIWGKRRIMEVYLNVVETGRGLYGVEAAARHYFGTGADALSRRQAVSLAVCLPRPLQTDPLNMPSDIRQRYLKIMSYESRNNTLIPPTNLLAH